MTGQALLQQIQAEQPDYGKLMFWWFGQMGFALKMGSKTLFVDLFLPGGERVRPNPATAEEICGVDFFFGTHNHGDHIDRRMWPVYAKNNPNAKFFVPDLLKKGVAERTGIDIERFIGINDGCSVTVDGITVTGVASAHEFLDQDAETGRYPHMGYVIEANGCKVYHSGDCCNYEGLQTKLSKFGQFNVMFLPINGRSGRQYAHNIIGNFTYQEAVDLAGMLQPKLVVPGHYDMMLGNTQDPYLFADFLESKYKGQKYWIGWYGEKVEV